MQNFKYEQFTMCFAHFYYVKFEYFENVSIHYM